MKRWFLGMTAALSLMGGCYKATFVTNAAPAGGTQTKKVFFFVYGLLGQPQKVDVRELCPSGTVHQIRTKLTVGNALLQGFTGGIVAPRTVEVQCGVAPGAQLSGQEIKSAELLLDDQGAPRGAVVTTQDGSQQVSAVEPAQDGAFSLTVH